ncbi:host attachment family protein [Oceanibacterium hippocampi]|uniref:Protein required for attachment to host cells n=1 Tax=Oceanibacterium hippocampi TaxID=745714 RepID=A0A1Y5S270_9PROT|nr:host attachment family protein [Oceanibacterium hippocampi]SLN30807.1 Protein required for attachment to host cells [Oceanibacterium hippocampi]
MTALNIPHDAWILIGDGEKALVLRNEGDEVYPNLEMMRLFEQDNPPSREQGTDRPGRMPDQGGVGSQHRSGMDEVDWHRLAKDRFAKEIAERFYRLAHAGKFAQLIVVAPPHVLGELRKNWHQEVSDRIVAEVDKTLTNHPVGEIEKVLT